MGELGGEGEIPITSWGLLIIYVPNALCLLSVPYCVDSCSIGVDCMSLTRHRYDKRFDAAWMKFDATLTQHVHCAMVEAAL